MLARLFTVLIWTLAAASATFWGFKLFASAPAARPDVSAGSGSDSNLPGSSELVRLLGGTALLNTPAAQVPAMSSRFRLAAIIAAPQASSSGVALISVDGKTARVFRVGAAIDGDMVLQSVGSRSASIGPAQGAPAVVLELPVLPLPSSGPAPVPSAFIAGTGLPATQDAAVAPAATPSRKVTQGERASPGRRLRLRGSSAGDLPPLVGQPPED
jgi:general secretion pathway protein C